MDFWIPNDNDGKAKVGMVFRLDKKAYVDYT